MRKCQISFQNKIQLLYLQLHIFFKSCVLKANLCNFYIVTKGSFCLSGFSNIMREKSNQIYCCFATGTVCIVLRMHKFPMCCEAWLRIKNHYYNSMHQGGRVPSPHCNQQTSHNLCTSASLLIGLLTTADKD